VISEDYRKLVELVQLEQLALTELQHRRVESELRVPLTVSTEFRVEPVTVEPGRLVARAYFDFRAKTVAPEDGDEEPQVEIRMVWRVQYALQNPGDVELDIQVLGPEFLERNVPINVWPFIRETLASLTAKMGAPPYLLPALRIVR